MLTIDEFGYQIVDLSERLITIRFPDDKCHTYVGTLDNFIMIFEAGKNHLIETGKFTR